MIIDGKNIAREITEELRGRVERLSFRPVFCDILVGHDPVSAQYVAMKGKAAQGIGIEFRRADLPASVTTGQVIEKIHALNNEPGMSGLIVQLPLPAHLDRTSILDAIEPRIDVDCTGAVNTGRFYSGQPYLAFPTAAAVMALLDSVSRSSNLAERAIRDLGNENFPIIDLRGKNILVVGQGALVGRPVTQLLRHRGLKILTADINTPNTSQLIKDADVVISATGQGKMITGAMIKPGAIVIDAGTSESKGGIVGDVHFESVAPVASFLSPVPGGVGPVTVVKLLENVVAVAELSNRQSNPES